MTQQDTDPTMTRILAAVRLGHEGEKARARQELTAVWADLGVDGDPLHRCTLAHYLADLQESTEEELAWDERALAAVASLTDERARRYDGSLQVRAFLPSLHLNLADCHRRLADERQARQHLTTARELVTDLPDDAYGDLIRQAIRDVSGALDAGSTDRLASHP
ncbi:hypothetical protein [Phytohabitans kaempferiae]|uniref:Tetratricopeptide repeat protein n=1 Tax=Phytohabitans kaempferiae TaxID=1620943 RepID=A0ABV6M9Q2_9ACTN